MTHYRERREAGEYLPENVEQPEELAELSKDELIEKASELGVDVSPRWTKAEIQEAIERTS
jgi:hypothetical protein